MQLAIKSSEGKPGPKYLLRSSVNEVSGGVISEAKPKTGAFGLNDAASCRYVLLNVLRMRAQTSNGKSTVPSSSLAQVTTMSQATTKSVEA